MYFIYYTKEFVFFIYSLEIISVSHTRARARTEHIKKHLYIEQ